MFHGVTCIQYVHKLCVHGEWCVVTAIQYASSKKTISFIIKKINKIKIVLLIVLCLRFHCWVNRIGGVMVSVLASSAVDHGSGRTKNYKIGICCFFAKYAALRRKSQDWLDRDSVSEWTDKTKEGTLISILKMLFPFFNDE
jgi:hypothetical protein